VCSSGIPRIHQRTTIDISCQPFEIPIVEEIFNVCSSLVTELLSKPPPRQEWLAVTLSLQTRIKKGKRQWVKCST